MGKYVYQFEEGKKEMKNLLGGKGANLAEMTNIGLPVPPGFTITTEACKYFFENNEQITDELEKEILKNIAKIEKKTGKKFGNSKNPLLVSVRSGAPVSMPGMMDTILNLGLNDDSIKGMAKLTNNPRLVYDSYRRLIQMFGDVVMKVPKEEFDNILESIKKREGFKSDIELNVDHLKEIISEYKRIFKKFSGIDFPQEPKVQLLMAVNAVFKSWQNPRAISYRNISKIPHDLGTAVNIQTMVFGNMGDNSATGVMFTRNPSTGEKKLYGEFLINAQGEDVVAGIRTPQHIDEMKNVLPENYNDLKKISNTLESHYKDMQDIEFTIENGKTFILQTRTGKRTAEAAVNIAVDMVNEGLIDKKTAIMRIDPKAIEQLLHPIFDSKELEKSKVIAKGLAASPGAATGRVYFTSVDAVGAAKKGERVILVRKETSPEDIDGMAKAEGFLTSRGGMTSHAAVVARQMGKCCIAGCGDIEVEEHNNRFIAGEEIIKEGDYISLDGNTGKVYKGKIKTTIPGLSGNFNTLLEWTDNFRRLGVWANADKAADAKKALDFGAEGIGLCRTEHMFFDDERINYVRRMIIAKDTNERIKALDKLFTFQKDDFKSLFETMKDKPVIIRLLDPPLHEFLPQDEKGIKELSKELNVDFSKLKYTVEKLKEFNPMLGHRGCRLGITYPEIYEMQTKAIIAAAVEVKRGKDVDVKPEIMIPLVGIDKEIKEIRDRVTEIADTIISESGIRLKYKVGTMIEVPRASLVADKIAEYADFFSFGTNDLTQMTFGFSRDDAGKFLTIYRENGILEEDPFTTIDENGVGKLVKMGVELGRSVKPDIVVGICGEHGGDPKSIELCNRIGLNYVSCSPYRVPVARLAAAQAAIMEDIEIEN
ncbi:pyruvate, phosphate dikinase [Thermohalobacter berrensis]|uniref:Pyruvate, phosphate dikinase n=1 Tax=Thermohalobacter berrensis TaxID=99594 RepID=A0A419T7F5_9FIRM|nr:pyruvate, phosphate dikinase [Thermohalobacter berrensis]RKD33490.1 pyruvate, phosphate dikinase [Thermohalobacter berrensis]